MTIEIGMPVYRPSGRLEAVLTNLSLQTERDFYISIYNNTPENETDEIERCEAIIENMRSRYGMRINHFLNGINLGYMKNMRQIFERATGDVLFLMADDDILSYDCIELVKKAFENYGVGVVARPYYWFIDDMRKPVRFEGEIYGSIQNVNILPPNTSDIKMIRYCISSAGQLTGLAFRREYLKDMPFVEDMFTAHVYPFLHIFKNHVCAYMPYPTIAVCIGTSQCHTDIYDPSPMEQWINLYKTVLSESCYDDVRKKLMEFVTTDFFGLAQIKNYGTYKELFTEIRNFIKYRKKNLISIKFYVFVLGSILCPRFLLKWLVDFYKQNVLSGRIKNMNIDFNKFPIDQIEQVWSYKNTRG